MTWHTFGRGDDSYSAELLKEHYILQRENKCLVSVKEEYLIQPHTPCRIFNFIPAKTWHLSRFMAKIKMFMDMIRLAPFPDSWRGKSKQFQWWMVHGWNGSFAVPLREIWWNITTVQAMVDGNKWEDRTFYNFLWNKHILCSTIFPYPK